MWGLGWSEVDHSITHGEVEAEQPLGEIIDLPLGLNIRLFGNCACDGGGP